MIALVVASALLHALAFPPANLAPLAWVALAPFFVALDGAAPRRAFALGALWGVVAHWAEAYWILPAMSTYYRQPWWFAVAFGIGSSLVFRGLHYGLFAAAASWLARGRRGAARTVVLALTWTAFELLRARGPTADPWLLLGYAAVPLPALLQVADLGGVPLVSFGMALANAALAETAMALRGTRAGAVRAALPALGLAGLVLAAQYAYGVWRLAAPAPAARVPIAIVQGNNDLGAQWHPEHDDEILATYLALSRAAMARARPRLLVWPESAVTFFLARDPRRLERVRALLAADDTALIAGAPHVEDGDPAVPSFYNSAFYVTATGIQARYDKVRLLPFAEYFPLRFADFLRRRFGRVRAFTPGRGAPLIDSDVGRLATVICFEAVFAELVRERMAAGADLLLNLSNDAWLGAGSGPAQHLAMVVPRAVENRTWVVRATTSGISAVIDPRGVVRDATPTFAQAVVEARVAPGHRSTLYQRWGDWFAAACALAVAGLALARARRGAGGARDRAAPPDPAAREPAWPRRLASIPLYGLAAAAAVALLPALLAAAALADLRRRDRRLARTRSAALLVVYLTAEVAGIAAAFLAWLRYRLASAGRGTGAPAADAEAEARYLEANFRLQCRWASLLVAAARRLLGLRLVVEGEAAVARGPFILFSRHCSIADGFLPAAIVSARHGVRLRWVMKRELLWDPCLDIVGNRLPNAFIRRESNQTARELAAIGRLMDDLGGRDAAFIYPEGTFLDPDQRRRALERLARTAPGLLDRAAALRHVLPPRLSGALALLAHNRGADAVFCAHTGLEGADSVRALLRGDLVGRTVRVAFWRVPFADIPQAADAQAAWLYDRWAELDRRIERLRSGGGDPTDAAP